jgi:hypothetical protein
MDDALITNMSNINLKNNELMICIKMKKKLLSQQTLFKKNNDKIYFKVLNKHIYAINLKIKNIEKIMS